MAAESIIALLVILLCFAGFSAVLLWAGHIAPPTFPGDMPSRSTDPARPPQTTHAAAGAH